MRRLGRCNMFFSHESHELREETLGLFDCK